MDLRRALPLTLTLAAACHGSSSRECTDPNTAGCIVASTKARVTSPNVPAADLDAAVAGNTAFALDLYQRIRGGAGNVFYSPFSISEALAMVSAGARGQTLSQLEEALHFTLPQGRLHPAFDELDLALSSRGQGPGGRGGQPFRLRVANALWGQIGYPFQHPFLDTLAEDYGAGVHVADFASPGEARRVIDDWVAEKTEDRIRDLVPEGSIDPTTRLFLANAVYFHASWQTPFDPRKTADAPFTRRDGSAVQVPTMRGIPEVGYGAGPGWAAVELPYAGHELSMALVLPDPGTLDAFEQGLTAERLDGILGGVATHAVAITMPRFGFTTRLDLGGTLSRMGMADAFGDAADLSGIDGRRDLRIQAVVHEAFVAVDEAGTEAAAATGATVGVTSVGEPAEIHLDHPFLFFIRDLATRTILFIGRVDDPNAG